MDLCNAIIVVARRYICILKMIIRRLSKLPTERGVFPRFKDVQQFLSNHCHNIGGAFRTKIASRTKLFHIAISDDNRILGVNMLKDVDDVLYITLLCTGQRGIGRTMMIAAYEDAIVMNKRAIVLCTVRESWGFYDKLGFKSMDKPKCQTMAKFTNEKNLKTNMKLEIFHGDNSMGIKRGCGDKNDNCLYMEKIVQSINSNVTKLPKIKDKQFHINNTLDVSDKDLRYAIEYFQGTPKDILSLFDRAQLISVANNQTLANVFIWHMKNRSLSITLNMETYFGPAAAGSKPTVLKPSSKLVVLKPTVSKPTTITHFEWGLVKTSDDQSFKDVIISNHAKVQSQVWDWKKFGLRHNPGYDTAVLKKIFDYVDSVITGTIPKDYKIILSIGVDSMIRTPSYKTTSPNSKKYNDYVVFQQSEKAYKEYNKRVKEGLPTLLFLHSTC